jgi:ketosteroid isomerase-like protein
LAESDESWEELQFDAEEFRDAGERVAVIGRLVGRARLTGADVNTRLAMLIEVRGNRVSAVRANPNVEEALQAAGLAG